MMSSLAEIREARRKHGLTQSQLAKLASVSQSLIAKVEAGRMDPGYGKVQQIFSVLEQLDRKQELKVGDIAVKRVLSASRHEMLQDAVRRMRQHSISQLPVLEHAKAVGILSETAIIDRIAQGENITRLSVGDVMEEAPPVVPSATPLTAVANLLRYTPMVLVSERGRLRGLVTKADVLKGAYRK